MTGLERHSVRIESHDPQWAALFAAEARGLAQAAGELAADIQHVGSTAVPGLAAKPILDIALAARDREAVQALAARLSGRGYIDRGDKGGDGGRLLVKESSPGVRTAHVHIVELSDPQWEGYVAFRGALLRDPGLRRRYGELKSDLAARYAGNRPEYTAHKAEFIRGVLAATRGAAPLMGGADLVALLRHLQRAGVEVWLDGGWGVDALLGEPHRPHKDVDLIPRVSDVPRLREALAMRGFALKQGSPPDSFVLADAMGLEVDVHAVRFDDRGNGVYRMENGQDWVYPAWGFDAEGVVGGLEVRCLSAEAQVLCHSQGYTPVEKDIRDMELLRERLGVELPPVLRRAAPGAPDAPRD